MKKRRMDEVKVTERMYISFHHLEHLSEANRASVRLVEVEDDANLLLEALGVHGLGEM